MDPSLYLPGAKSVLVVGYSYYKTVTPFSGSPSDQTVPNEARRGRLSFIAVGEDYHRTLSRKLQSLVESLSVRQAFQYKIHVDTGPLLEKDLAVKAELGFKGKNSLVISPKLGSFFTIGLLVTDLPLEEQSAKPTVSSFCGDCTRCIDACPTGALSRKNPPDWSKCVSYLTQTRDLAAEKEALLGDNLYGCDRCQLACPYNQSLSGEETDWESLYPTLDPIAGMSRKELKRHFGFTAAGWRADCVKRNAKVILGIF